MKQLKVYRSLATSLSVGWQRDDLPLVHVIAQAEPGEVITPSKGPQGGPHWPCTVCENHGYSEKLFYEQLPAALEKGPASQ